MGNEEAADTDLGICFSLDLTAGNLVQRELSLLDTHFLKR